MKYTTTRYTITQDSDIIQLSGISDKKDLICALVDIISSAKLRQIQVCGNIWVRCYNWGYNNEPIDYWRYGIHQGDSLVLLDNIDELKQLITDLVQEM